VGLTNEVLEWARQGHMYEVSWRISDPKYCQDQVKYFVPAMHWRVDFRDMHRHSCKRGHSGNPYSKRGRLLAYNGEADGLFVLSSRGLIPAQFLVLSYQARVVDGIAKATVDLIVLWGTSPSHRTLIVSSTMAYSLGPLEDAVRLDALWFLKQHAPGLLVELQADIKPFEGLPLSEEAQRRKLREIRNYMVIWANHLESTEDAVE